MPALPPFYQPPGIKLKSLIKVTHLERYIRDNIPNFEIREKKKSPFMIFLSKVLFFNTYFSTQYVTTIYPYVYVPDINNFVSNPNTCLPVLAHEFIHLKDIKKYSQFLFSILYLIPQIFALLALLTIFSSKWWLLCLLFLLPLPAPFRAYFEFKAYCITITILYLLFNGKCETNYYIRQFATSRYYWMWPFKKYVEKKFNSHLQNLSNGVLSTTEREIKSVLRI